MLEVDIENRAFPNSPIVSRDFQIYIIHLRGHSHTHPPIAQKKRRKVIENKALIMVMTKSPHPWPTGAILRVLQNPPPMLPAGRGFSLTWILSRPLASSDC